MHDVAAEDVQKIAALMRQHTSMPVVVIKRHDRLVEASAGCCSTVPDDCSIFKAHLEVKEGLWTVVDSSQTVE